MITGLIWLIFKLCMFASGVAFWAFIVYAFAGIQKKLVFSKEHRFLGYVITIMSEAQKGLEVKIKKG